MVHTPNCYALRLCGIVSFTRLTSITIAEVKVSMHQGADSELVDQMTCLRGSLRFEDMFVVDSNPVFCLVLSSFLLCVTVCSLMRQTLRLFFTVPFDGQTWNTIVLYSLMHADTGWPLSHIATLGAKGRPSHSALRFSRRWAQPARGCAPCPPGPTRRFASRRPRTPRGGAAHEYGAAHEHGGDLVA